MKNFKRILLIFILFSIYIFLSFFSYANTISEDLSQHIFRLHVIANSNSKEDQDLKYAVRDALISYMQSISGNITTKEEAISLANKNQEKFYQIAKEVVESKGYNYDVHITVGNDYFPTKYYGDIALPAGYYDALKVEIGAATGQNWWCVMFPSLCFIDVTNGVVPEESKETLQEQLQAEDYNLISSDEPVYKVKFKLVELLENAKMMLAKK